MRDRTAPNTKRHTGGVCEQTYSLPSGPGSFAVLRDTSLEILDGGDPIGHAPGQLTPFARIVLMMVEGTLEWKTVNLRVGASPAVEAGTLVVLHRTPNAPLLRRER
jgi:hypothetical protein